MDWKTLLAYISGSVDMARENRSWGYDRLAGALAELGYEISDHTVSNILKRRGLPAALGLKKTTTWAEFIRTHTERLWATDFVSTEAWTIGGSSRSTSCSSSNSTPVRSTWPESRHIPIRNG